MFSDVRATTGMIIPIWYPATTPAPEMETLISACIDDACVFAEPSRILAVVDGAPAALAVARRSRRRRKNFQILALNSNLGKGGAVAAGIKQLLANPSVQYLVTRDHDNDHLAQDTPNLVRLTAKMTTSLKTDLVAVIGRRTSTHRHLGFTRGEFEWFMNEVAYNAARFAMARQNNVPCEQFCAAYEQTPDMQTGFKCYTRASAALLVQTLEEAERFAPGLDVRRHGAEIPILIEILLQGGALGEINRLAYEHQPLTTYDLAGRIAVNGTVLAWVLQRAEIPLPAARQILLNAAARRLLAKEEAGCNALMELINWTLSRLAGIRGKTIEPVATPAMADYF